MCKTEKHKKMSVKKSLIAHCQGNSDDKDYHRDSDYDYVARKVLTKNDARTVLDRRKSSVLAVVVNTDKSTDSSGNQMAGDKLRIGLGQDC